MSLGSTKMQTSYFILRKTKVVDDMGDQEYFCGHKPRRWFSWLPPRARWETGHLPTHEDLWRFRSREEALAYMERHKMNATMIELVYVVKST